VYEFVKDELREKRLADVVAQKIKKRKLEYERQVIKYGILGARLNR